MGPRRSGECLSDIYIYIYIIYIYIYVGFVNIHFLTTFCNSVDGAAKPANGSGSWPD
jgi:hypothetical protein